MSSPLFKFGRFSFSVRAYNMNFEKYGLPMRIAFKWECILSRFADSVIANSFAGKIDYQKVFSFPHEISVVQNGINTETFKPDTDKRVKQRTSWNVSDKDILIGIVGRMDPMKGYSVFIQAVAIAAQKHPELRFVCAGDGPESYVLELKALACRLGVNDRIIWDSFNRDMTVFYNALEMFTPAFFLVRDFLMQLEKQWQQVFLVLLQMFGVPRL